MFYIGLDLGQKVDPSAVAVVELVEEAVAWRPVVYRDLRVRWLERIALGTPYVGVVRRIEEIVAHPSLAGKCHLTVDATGVGNPVVEMMRRRGMGCSLTAVTITGGAKANGNGADVNVPKVDLLSGLQVLLEKGELRISKQLRETGSLVRELVSMRRKGGSEGEHDDLAMAVALACWSAKQPRNGFGTGRLV